MRPCAFLGAWVRLLSRIQEADFIWLFAIRPASQPSARETVHYFQSRHGLTCRWPPPQACCGGRFAADGRLSDPENGGIQSSSSATWALRKAISAGLALGLPARWPQMLGIGRSTPDVR